MRSKRPAPTVRGVAMDAAFVEEKDRNEGVKGGSVAAIAAAAAGDDDDELDDDDNDDRKDDDAVNGDEHNPADDEDPEVGVRRQATGEAKG
jgi:hypothetical protein